MMGALTNVATVAGYLALAQLAWQFLGFLRFNLRGSGLHRYGKSHRLYKREPAKRQNEQAGPWALVTGASDGLGLTFANELAARGFNLIIHGRNPQKLDGIKASLVKKHANIHVRTLVVDGEDHRVYDADTFSQTVLAAIGDIPLTLLVNNISVLGTWTALHERTPASLDKFLNLNIRFLTRLTALAIPVLQRHSPALILNISSGASHVPLPWSAPYAGVKAYSESLHRSLRYELRFIPEMKDVEVLTLEYGTVCTPSTGRTDKDATWDIPTTERAVRAGLGCVGSVQTVVVPYWGHQVQAWLAASLPRSVADNFVAGMMREQKSRMDKLAEGKTE